MSDQGKFVRVMLVNHALVISVVGVANRKELAFGHCVQAVQNVWSREAVRYGDSI